MIPYEFTEKLPVFLFEEVLFFFRLSISDDLHNFTVNYKYLIVTSHLREGLWM